MKIDENESIFFFLDLLRSLEPVRVEDHLNTAISYFKSTSLCTHIIGSNLPYIQDSIHNRKSFVYCLHQAIQGYDENYEVSAAEFHAILDTLFPGFPWSIILDTIHSASGDSSSGSSADSMQRFSVIVLCKILSFQVLFEQWLKATEDIFKNEGKIMVLSLHSLRTQMEGLQRNLGTTLYQPSFCAISSVLDTYEGNRSGGEISFQRFKSSVMAHDAVQAELNLLQNYPAML